MARGRPPSTSQEPTSPTTRPSQSFLERVLKDHLPNCSVRCRQPSASVSPDSGRPPNLDACGSMRGKDRGHCRRCHWRFSRHVRSPGRRLTGHPAHAPHQVGQQKPAWRPSGSFTYISFTSSQVHPDRQITISILAWMSSSKLTRNLLICVRTRASSNQILELAEDDFLGEGLESQNEAAMLLWPPLSSFAV